LESGGSGGRGGSSNPDRISKKEEIALADRLSKRDSPQPSWSKKSTAIEEPPRSARDQQDRMDRLLADVPKHRRSKSAVEAEKKKKKQAASAFPWSVSAAPASESCSCA
jgi:hypothetical protein